MLFVDCEDCGDEYCPQAAPYKTSAILSSLDKYVCPNCAEDYRLSGGNVLYDPK